MKQVRALKMGYYNNARIREGQIFYVKNDKEISKEWMEVLSEESVSNNKMHGARNMSTRRPTQVVDHSDEVI